MIDFNKIAMLFRIFNAGLTKERSLASTPLAASMFSRSSLLQLQQAVHQRGKIDVLFGGEIEVYGTFRDAASEAMSSTVASLKPRVAKTLRAASRISAQRNSDTMSCLLLPARP